MTQPEPPTPTSLTPRKRDRGLVGALLGGRYRLVAKLGEGGMATVYLAEHVTMKKRVAVKVLHHEVSQHGEMVARFEREALAAAHIDHPHVAKASDLGRTDDGAFYLVLEYLEGQSLRQALAQGPLGCRRALGITRQVALALDRAHAMGIVHRDLKPDNVMLVRRDDEADFVKVLDFGMARVPAGQLRGLAQAPTPVGQGLSKLGMLYGTPEYMSPEQALGRAADGRSDLYALGVMLFEILLGRRPFESNNSVALLSMHAASPPPVPSSIAPSTPPSLDELLLRLLAKEPSSRFASALEVVSAIDALLAGPLPEHLASRGDAPASLDRPDRSMVPHGSNLPEVGRKSALLLALVALLAAVSSALLLSRGPMP